MLSILCLPKIVFNPSFLDSIIIKIADFYDEQVDNKVAVINKLLEPLIIVTLAVIVWFIAISIMQPIMNLADTVSNS